MNIKNKNYLALDTSYEKGAVALFCGDTILYEQSLTEKFAHGKLIAPALADAQKLCDDVDGLLCGIGPGSFVGVRIALATALGFSFAQALALMSFCSHEALAYSTGATRDFWLFMKASGDLGYLSSYKVCANGLQEAQAPHVVAVTDLANLFTKGALVFSDHVERVHSHVTHVAINELRGPTPQGIVMAARARMTRCNGYLDERATIKPNYVKAPSVSVPKHLKLS